MVPLLVTTVTVCIKFLTLVEAGNGEAEAVAAAVTFELASVDWPVVGVVDDVVAGDTAGVVEAGGLPY